MELYEQMMLNAEYLEGGDGTWFKVCCGTRIGQRFPVFYVCDSKAANGVWLATVPQKRQ